MNYNTLRTAIAAAIKTPANPQISGAILQQQLIGIVNALDLGALYLGMASTNTVPSTEANGFYFATTEGTYTNFLNSGATAITVSNGEIALLVRSGNAWAKEHVMTMPYIDPTTKHWIVDGKDSGVLAEGQQGQPGAPGQNAYVHIKYAAAVPASAQDMHDSYTNGDKYIGVYSGDSAIAPTTVNSYQWAKFVGEDGTSIGSFKYKDYDADAAEDLVAVGDTTTEDIGGLSAGSDTLDVIVLMPNAATSPTKTMMIATQDDGNGRYEFVYVGDLQDAIPNDIFSGYAKNTLLALLRKVAYIDGNGETYIGTLESALFPDKELLGITALYTQSGAVYTTDSLDDLKVDLEVTASYSDGTSETISDYVLSGTLAEGTSVITVEYRGEEATFNVTVSVGLLGHWLIGKGFEQYPIGGNVERYVYATDSTHRAIYIDTSGTYPFKYRSGSLSGQSSGLYPVILPTVATSIEAISTDANVLLAIFALEYTEGKWHRIGYIEYTTNPTLAMPSGATHFAIQLKYGSEGTADITQAMVDSVTVNFQTT